MGNENKTILLPPPPTSVKKKEYDGINNGQI